MLRSWWTTGLMLLALAGTASGQVNGPSDGPVRRASRSAERAFADANPGTQFYRTGQRITSIYGEAFSGGPTARASAEAFRTVNAPVFGVPAHELVEGTLAGDGVSECPMMPDPETGHLKFTLLSYLQQRDGVPVFRADLRLLVRNDPGYPLVLARANIRELGAFRVNLGAAENPNLAGALAGAMKAVPGIGNFSTPRLVIWAGVDEQTVTPRLALEFYGTVGDPALPGYDRLLILADAATGKVLWSESQVCHANITGSVAGMATPPTKADICAEEVLTPMPYALINGPSGQVFADAAGGFVYPATGQVTLTSPLRGKWFRVFDANNPGVDIETLSADVSPPGPVSFQHNPGNASNTYRSGVNAYINANAARDYAILYSPMFPTITTQTDFKVNINITGLCNAFYDGSSINFYPAGGICPSAAFSDIVRHEYTHHLVAMAGSGQAGYGEGAADMMALLMSDAPEFGLGRRTK